MGKNDRLLTFSDEFLISCGAVSIDPTTKKVLLLKHRQNNKYVLAKGRKNQGECLQSAAVRETTEETGYLCTLVPHSGTTKAPLPVNQEPGGHHMEPIAIQQRVYGDGIRKLIFWCLAEADSMQVPLEPVDDGVHYDAMWLDFEEAIREATHDDDAMLIERVEKIVMSN